MKNLKNFAVVLTLLASCGAGAEPLPQTELTMGMYRIDAEVAATQSAREQGLMHRQKMKANNGMLFVFPVARQECMWMKNTVLPLSVAFLDDQGTIINIEEMKPKTLDIHCSTTPARYALEMNAGWFKQHGFSPGAQLRGLELLPLPQ